LKERDVDKKTLQERNQGENRREAHRQRDLRDWQDAVNKGYRNKAIEERLKK
jgi:hypothetical protein